MITVEEIRSAIRSVIDPEIGFSIVDMGLVYNIDVSENGLVMVYLTLTSPMCPIGSQLVSAVEAVVSGIEGVKGINVELVWDPPWDPRRHASEDVKAMLGIWDFDED